MRTSASHPTISHHIAPHRITSHRITSHRITSHRIASHRIASHRIVPHHIASHHAPFKGTKSLKVTLLQSTRTRSRKAPLPTTTTAATLKRTWTLARLWERRWLSCSRARLGKTQEQCKLNKGLHRQQGDQKSQQLHSAHRRLQLF